jgi:hypothetical protein
MTLAGVKEWLKGVYPEAEHFYIGKLSTKHGKSLGIYHRELGSDARVALGGNEQTSYDVKGVSLLLHWSSDAAETEQAASYLFNRIRNIESQIQVGEKRVYMIQLRVPEPQDVGTDDKGIYERVIWLDFYYERRK